VAPLLSLAQSAVAVQTWSLSVAVQLSDVEVGQSVPQNDFSVEIVQYGNAAPSGLSTTSAVAQHCTPASDEVQSEGPSQPTVSSGAHVPSQAGFPVAMSAQHTSVPVHGVPGHEPGGAPPELLLPLLEPLLEPLLLPLLLPPLELPLDELPLLLLPLLELPLLLLPLELLPDDEPPLELPLGGATVDELPLHATQTMVHATRDAAPKTSETDARETMGKPPGGGGS
jgi:hypothetical protein